jgi:hypothetical protein
MKAHLFTGWHFMRWLRLALGVIIGISAFQTHDSISGFVAAFFLFQAVTNTGCCGANGCTTTNTSTSKVDSASEIEYEEVEGK